MSRSNVLVHRCGTLHSAAALVLTLFISRSSDAQPRPPADLQPRSPTSKSPPVTMPSAPHVEETLVPTVKNGLTSEQAARRAVATSYSAKSAEENARAAAARTEQAALDYVPDVNLLAYYKRLSPVTPPSTFGTVSTQAATGTTNPPIVADPPTFFPVFFDNYVMQATLVVPLSDYFLKVNRSYSAATRSEEASRLDVLSAQTSSSASAKQSYYEWLRDRGALVVAEQTRAVAQAHRNDAQTQFGAGAVAAADVFRAEAALSAAELLVERAKALATSSEWAIRTIIHATGDERLEPGEALDEPLTPVTASVQQLLAEAYASRPELRSLDKNADAARELASAARAAELPALSGLADLTYANPNPRKFPATNDFFASWSVGAQLSWSPKKFLSAGPAAGEQLARAASLEAQRNAMRDTIVRAVVDAYAQVIASDAAVSTTTRQLDSELEAYRVSRQLYNVGRTTGTAILQAQQALAQARFDHLRASADARIARAQLEHAVGRDAHVRPR